MASRPAFGPQAVVGDPAFRLSNMHNGKQATSQKIAVKKLAHTTANLESCSTEDTGRSRKSSPSD